MFSLSFNRRAKETVINSCLTQGLQFQQKHIAYRFTHYKDTHLKYFIKIPRDEMEAVLKQAAISQKNFSVY